MPDECIAEATQLVESRYSRWGRLSDIARLVDGWDNDNFLITSASGTRSVLRRYRVSTRREVEHEVELMKVLSRVHFPTPALVRADSNDAIQHAQGSCWLMVDYLSDCRYPSATEWRTALELMQRLHVVGMGFRGPTVREKFRNLPTRFRQAFKGHPDERDLEFLWQVVAAEERLGLVLDAPEEEIRFSCVHYDVNPRNVLIDRQDRAWLIDFDEVVFAPITVDLAGFVHYWCVSESGELDLSRAKDIVMAYGRLSELRPAELARLPAEILRYQLRDCMKYCLGELETTPGFQLRDSTSFHALHAVHDSLCAGTLEFSDVT